MTDIAVPAEGDFSVQAEETPAAPVKAAPKKVAAKPVKTPKIHVVSGAFVDPVEVKRLTADTNRRKSLSVHHLQRRLAELGYNDAAAAVDGRYDTLTAAAVAAWQKDAGFEGALTVESVSALFEGDPNVEVLP